MKNRKMMWFAIAVLALLFCGFGTGLVPGGMGLLPLRQIFAEFEVYGIYFPMAAVTGVYAPYGQNTSYLPIRAATDWENPPDSVEFFLDTDFLGADTSLPFSGYVINLQDQGVDGSVVVHDIFADAYEGATYENTASGEIRLTTLPDRDANGIPESLFGGNNPFALPTPNPFATDHTVYVGRVQIPEDTEFFSAVASVIPPPLENTPELTYVMAGSPTGDFQDVLFEINDGAVWPDMNGRFVVRAAASRDDLDAVVSEGSLALISELGIPEQSFDPLVLHLAAFDAHLFADVEGTPMVIEDLGAYPMTVRVTFPILIPNTPELMARIGMPIFYADTSVDSEYNIMVDSTEFVQLPVEQVIENTAELVFQIESLSTYVPMLHEGAPVLDPMDPDALVPASGPSAGCTPLSIQAFGSLDETNLIVEFGANPATDVNVVLNTVELSGPHLVTCVTPAGDALGPVDVRITNPDVDGWPIFAMLDDAYTYTVSTPLIESIVPDIGYPGTTFTITGTEFDPNVTVTFDGTVVPVTVENCTTITGNVPTLPAGIYQVTVTDPLSENYDYVMFEILRAITRTRGGSGGPCFIATAAYGTPMADQLETLRTFRDRYLLTNVAGTALMRAYYKYSPAVAHVVATNAVLRALTRAMLTALLTPLWVKLVLAGLIAGAAAIIRRKVTA